MRSWARRTSLLALLLVWVAALPVITTAQSASPVPSPAASAAPPSLPASPPVDPVPGGLPWQPAAPPLSPNGTRLTDLTPWRHGFAAVQMRDDRALAIWRSGDGFSWDTSPVPARLRGVQGLVAFDGGLALIVATSNATLPWAFEVWRSDDARHWTHAGRFVAQLPVGLHDCQVNDRVVTVADGRVVAIAAVCRDLCCGIGPSPDGPAIATIGLAAKQPTARGGTFVWTSPTGRVWTRHRARGVADGSGYEFLPLVTRTVDGLLALRFGRPGSLLRSADGVHWQEVGPLPDGFDMDAWYAVTATTGGYVLAGAVGDDDVAHVWTGTPDGAWTSTLEADERTYIPDLGVAGDTVIASGYRSVEVGDAVFEAHPMIVVSFDGGTTWDSDASWTASADDWPLSEDSCLGSMVATIPVAVLVGCPSGTSAMFSTRVPLRSPGAPTAAGSPPPGPSLAPPVTPPPGDPPTIRPSGPPSASARGDGTTLEVWLPDDPVAAGDWLPAHVRITNHRRGPIFYQCGPVGAALELPALFPPGRTWTGTLATFKQQVLLRLRQYLDPVVRCPRGDSGYWERLGPGRTRDYDLLALPRYPIADQPLPSGTLPLITGFSFATGRSQDRYHDVVATATVEVTGPAWDRTGPAEAVDAALMDPTFGAWVAERDLTSDPNLTGEWDIDLRPLAGPDGDMYRGFVGYQASGPANQLYIELDAGSDLGGGSVARVLLDPFTGQVLATSFGP